MDSSYTDLSQMAIKALGVIILAAVLGIVFLSFWGLGLRYGAFGSGFPVAEGGVADEALSVLGNIASASVGGLVGWLARDLLVLSKRVQDAQAPETPEEPVTRAV